MTHANPERKDTWLLLAVAALVVCGVAGLALLAGLSVDDEVRTTPVAANATPAPSAVEPPAILGGSYSEDPLKTPGSTVGPEVEPAPVEATCPTSDAAADPYSEGQRAWAAREYETAAACFSADAMARPESAYTFYMLGLASWKAGRLDDAATALRTSAELNGGSIRTWVNLSRVDNDRGRFDEALAAAEKALTLEADNPSALYLQARSLRNLGRIDEAVAALESCLSIDDGQGYAHNLLGLIRLDVGEGNAAIESFRRAAERLPDVAFVQNNLGQALEAEHRFGEALLAYHRALELDESHPSASVAVARIEPRVPDGALSEVVIVEAADPESGEATVETVTTAANGPADGAGPDDGGTP